MMIGVSNHLLSMVLRLHSQKVIGSLGPVKSFTTISPPPETPPWNQDPDATSSEEDVTQPVVPVVESEAPVTEVGSYLPWIIPRERKLGCPSMVIGSMGYN